MTTTHTQPAGCDLDSLRDLIANDGFAMSFQSMGQYRAALIAAARAAQAPQVGQDALTDAQITAGADVLCDCRKPKRIGRNAAIDVFHAMTAAGAQIEQQAAQAPQGDTRQGVPVAYLHQVVCGDGEPDQALSFAPDNFPLAGTLGYRSLSHQPLYLATPAAHTRTPADEWAEFETWHAKKYPCDPLTGPSAALRWSGFQAARATQGAGTAPVDKHLPGWERGIATVTMNGHQLRAALDFINPDGDDDEDQRDNELTFGIVAHKDDDGKESTGLCCWNDDTDGVLPLDGAPDDQKFDREAERLTRAAGLGGGRINPNATSVLDIFLDDPAPVSTAAATTASATGRELYETWVKSAGDTLAGKRWDELSESTQVHWNKQSIHGHTDGQQGASRAALDDWLNQAADMLQTYHAYLMQLSPINFDEHPYLPSIEETAEELRAFARNLPAQAGTKGANGQGSAA